MKYLAFTIKNYRAITEPLRINISKRSLAPIIGINECGKTTILNAIFAFDSVNDERNEGKHVKDFLNLYSTVQTPAIISAEIEITAGDLLDTLKEIGEDGAIPEEEKKGISTLKKRIKALGNAVTPMVIDRNLESKKYSINHQLFSGFPLLSEHAANKIVPYLPFILYFDDFTDSVDDVIEIIKNPDGSMSTWLSIMEELFKRTNPKYSVFALATMDPRQKKSVLADVTARLNKTLTKEWSKFSLEKGNVLEVDIGHDDNKFHIQIKEDAGGSSKFFGIKDRSKGFYWFFNFVLKLEFNPKVRDEEDKDTIYLLDEPGSYLHANAQNKLCEKLAFLSKNNVVIYCTHSHHLLNPESIPISSVRIVEKDGNGSISLKAISEYSGSLKETRGAFQPLLEALEVRPLAFDYNTENAVIVEGIYDYYVFELFKSKLEASRKLNFLPSVNANSIAYNISFMIYSRVKYAALWDNDDEGKKEFGKASKYFGAIENKKFMLLPSETAKRKYVIQDLFASSDLNMIKTDLELPRNASFEKVILSWFYSPDKSHILAKISDVTEQRIHFVFERILEKLG